ncbi:MAG: signal recognition particle-docking protein FtsY [Chloroflexi bacterium]|nr:signal recognition particle-docking protein FtsY [Chloroflexota bacterium]
MLRFFRRSPKVEAPDEEGVETAADAVDVEDEQLAEEVQERTEQALQRTKRSWFGSITGLFDRGTIDEELWEELEELLIGADVGVSTTQKILDRVRERVEQERLKDAGAVREALKEALVDILNAPHGAGQLWRRDDAGEPPPKPGVILVLGVNGTGKTTTIAKLAHAYKAAGEQAIIAAADTFRAAAIEQMKEWGERVGADVIAHKLGADPSAVVFDAMEAAESRNADIVIIDTAGRLHTKFNLMQELGKIRRTIQRKEPSAPHEVLLVLDATIGQNAVMQAEAFTEAVDVTAACLTKLDGTAKGGIVFAISDELGIPMRFVGTGEQPEDLAPFSAETFVDALFEQ